MIQSMSYNFLNKVGKYYCYHYNIYLDISEDTSFGRSSIRSDIQCSRQNYRDRLSKSSYILSISQRQCWQNTHSDNYKYLYTNQMSSDKILSSIQGIYLQQLNNLNSKKGMNRKSCLKDYYSSKSKDIADSIFH